MFSCYFLRIIRQSIQVLCPLFSRKVQCYSGVLKGQTKFTLQKHRCMSVSRQDFVKHILMRKQCLMFMLLLAASTAVTQELISR